MKVKFWILAGFGSRTVIVDLPDSWTDEEIQKEFEGWREKYLEYGWSKK